MTRRHPLPEELEDLLLAWKVVRHVKSNAVILAKGGQLIGLGAGQANRALASELAVAMAGPRADGAVCASDAYFPSADGPEALAKAGVRAIIQDRRLPQGRGHGACLRPVSCRDGVHRRATSALRITGTTDERFRKLHRYAPPRRRGGAQRARGTPGPVRRPLARPRGGLAGGMRRPAWPPPRRRHRPLHASDRAASLAGSAPMPLPPMPRMGESRGRAVPDPSGST